MDSGRQQFQQPASDYWRIADGTPHKSAEISWDIFNTTLSRASTLIGKDPVVAQAAANRAWRRGVQVSANLWEKAKLWIIDYMPEDRDPFWVCIVVALVACLAIAGLRIDITHFRDSKKVDILHISAQRIRLPDGRYIAYCEQGVSPELSQRSILVVHGFLSSRLAGIPGIRDDLLQEFGVRLVAYDRPGFGQSDPHPCRTLFTSAQDMEYIADAVGMGSTFWVLGYSIGGIHAWAAMKYIPERLAGVAMFAPGGNPYGANMTKAEIDKVWGILSLRRKIMYIIARRAAFLLPSLFRRNILQKIHTFNEDLLAIVGKKDQVLVGQKYFVEMLNKDVQESVLQNNADTLAEEIIMQVHDWGFHLSDFRIRKKNSPQGILQWIKSYFQNVEEEWEGFMHPIHIWQGTDDKLVPFGMNEFAKRMIPQANFHELEEEGHFSYFCFCDRCHREIFETLFGSLEEPEDMTPLVELPLT